MVSLVTLIIGVAYDMGLATSVFPASCCARLGICNINHPGIYKATKDIRSGYPGCLIFATAVDMTDGVSLKRSFVDAKRHIGSIHGGLFNVLKEALEPNFMFSKRGYANGAVFAAIKHAVVGIVKSTALEVGKHSIRVNSVLLDVHSIAKPPTFFCSAVDMPMYQLVIHNAGMSLSAADTLTPRPRQPQEIAYATGTTWNVSGGANT
ncbi:hypothetical protein BDV27DRAFT_150691 [Aspergillus caelatus]|uniref:Uncharacterized protein n=1 Tax=Aspergillus caelatus TaxID=61420 RepID=A0A5N6ZLA2_9EURO|nr:uncharacterized protein BDV27DRAFT_150691 [Aspergillus caelatus]KAE8358168.1 hypothetical protein BDV27DRAFT_150691 [Aspergillus caelatus]